MGFELLIGALSYWVAYWVAYWVNQEIFTILPALLEALLHVLDLRFILISNIFNTKNIRSASFDLPSVS
jgi:hypothetical protein